MKKIFTALGLVAAFSIFFDVASAQNQPMSGGRIRSNLTGARFLVNSPASISGLKKITLAPWAGQLPTPIINQPVVQGFDSLAASPLTNAAAINGKVCLLYRGGGINYIQKVQYAENAGAIAVIIVNNVPGDPVGMGNPGTSTYTIPAVMVSDVNGQLISNQLRASVPVFVSLGAWGLGAPHDLAILPGYQSGPHALAIPSSQLAKGTGRTPYKNFTAGAILNYGTASETNITVRDSVVWNPTTGAASTIHQGSYNVSSIGSTDSVRFGFGGSTTSWDIPFTNPSTGYFNYNYRLTYGNTDAYPDDNIYNFRQYVTDSIFCKGNYDFTTNSPKVTIGFRPSNATTAWSWGPLYYVADDSFAARKLQYRISKSTGTPTLDGSETFALLYKWTDGLGGQPLDSFVEAPELKLVGVGYKAFTTADSSGAVITLPIRDAINPAKTVVMDSNSWYWTAAQATSDAFIGVDQSISYFTRSYEQSQVFGFQEHPEAIYVGDYSNLATETGAVVTFAFGGNGYYIDSTFFDAFYYIPNIALHISKQKIPRIPEGIQHVGSTEIGELDVFPIPASSSITVDVRLVKNFNKVAYRLLDIGGRVVYSTDHMSVRNDRFEIPSGNIASGIYHLVVIADELLTTRQVVIRH
jgi:hypothetical protein